MSYNVDELIILNRIFIRRKHKMLILEWNEASNSLSKDVYVLTAVKNIQSYGYAFEHNLLQKLRKAPLNVLFMVYEHVEYHIKEMLGANVTYNPMYPGFPKQVFKVSGLELYVNSLLHYVSGGKILPYYSKELTEIKQVNLDECILIEEGTFQEFTEIFVNLMSSHTSLSVQDMDDLYDFFKLVPDAYSYIPENIPIKENIAYIASLLLKNKDECLNEFLSKYIKTATDVLRFAAVLSDGDVSLTIPSRYGSFPRKIRVLLLKLLEDLGDIEEDMWRHKNYWIRLGERLHPGEYPQFSKTLSAFKLLRNSKKGVTFASKLDSCFRSNNIEKALEILKTRPGELARKLDFLIRQPNINSDYVIEIFSSIASKVSTRVLLQVKEHFTSRYKGSEFRVFLPRKGAARLYAIPNNLPSISQSSCSKIIDICTKTIIEEYSKLSPLGKVYLDPNFKNFTIPFMQRSASRSLKSIAQGSRLPIKPSDTTIRSFLWWKNGKERTDLDLTAVFVTENFEYVEHISFTNLRSEILNAAHSGDIVDAPKGACEYIDIDLESANRCKIRYVVLNVYSYTTQPFSELKECFMGWMGIENPVESELFVPSKVEQKIDLITNSKISIPMIIDVEAHEIIWADMPSMGEIEYNCCIENNITGIMRACKALTLLEKTSMYDLIKLHIAARGVEVSNPKDADVVFSMEEGITPFDMEVFQAYI